MDNQSYNIRVPKRWVRIALIVGVTALIVAPLSAVATNAFNDVPNTNTHHDDITWVRDADVTRGCNPPANDRYCPNDVVTRAQMASFMERLATNQVVDAGELGGEEPSAFRTEVAYFDCGFVTSSSTDCATASIPAGSGTLIGETTLTVPSGGVTELTGTVSADTTGAFQSGVWITRASTCATAPDNIVNQAIGGKLGVTSEESGVVTIDVSAVESVAAGTRTYKLCAILFEAPAARQVWTANLYARWTEAPGSVIVSSDVVTDHGGGGIGG